MTDDKEKKVKMSRKELILYIKKYNKEYQNITFDFYSKKEILKIKEDTERYIERNMSRV